MKFENPNWRYDSPGPLPDMALYRFVELASTTAAQGRVQDILEDFKSRFPGENGYWKSSTAKYADDDLRRDMRLHSGNAPLFIEAFVNACADIREQGLDAPSIDSINFVLFQTKAGYQIEGDVIAARIWTATQDAQVDVRDEPHSVVQRNDSNPRMEPLGTLNPPDDTYNAGRGRSIAEQLAEIKESVVALAATPNPIPTQSKPQLKVFLCHSSGDKLTVKEIYRRLKADGFDPWLDAVNLKPGQDWEAEIKRAVRASHTVIVFLSNGSVGKAGFVQKEIKFALDVADEQPEGQIFIIPARLEHCEVPDRLSKWHWVSLFEADGYDRLVDALLFRALSL